MRKILTIPTLSASLLLQGTLACAESDVGAFQSTVTIQGNIGQSSSGTNNRQDLNVGSASNSRTRSFNANVSTGAIRQSAQGSGIQQRINVGSMQNSQASTFSATVQTRSIEQVATKSGQRQELDIGSVTNSTINGAANTSVHVGQDIRQIGSGEIVLGSVKNSTIGNFNQNLTVQGKLIGNNIRMGSVIGQERYGNDGRNNGVDSSEQSPENSFEPVAPKVTAKAQSSGLFTSPSSSKQNMDAQLTGAGALNKPVEYNQINQPPIYTPPDITGFRHSSSNAAAGAAFAIAPVTAEIKDGEIVFKNSRYDAVTAYIHDKNGKVVRAILIPGAMDSNFTAGASAAMESIENLTATIFKRNVNGATKPIKEYLDKKGAFALESKLFASDIPDGGAISYASGTPEAILATVAGGVVKAFTTMVSALPTLKHESTPEENKDSIKDFIKGMSMALTIEVAKDSELIITTSKLAAEGKIAELTSVIAKWMVTKGARKADAYTKERLINPNIPIIENFLSNIGKDSTVILSKLKAAGDALVSASQFRDAWIQSTAGPKVLWYDMPYRKDNNMTAKEYKFNWAGTPLAQYQKTVYSTNLNEKDHSPIKVLKPSTWNDRVEAEYGRYRKE